MSTSSTLPPGEKLSLLEASLQSSLATMDVICETFGDDVASLPDLSTTTVELLDKIGGRIDKINKYVRERQSNLARTNSPLHQKEIVQGKERQNPATPNLLGDPIDGKSGLVESVSAQRKEAKFTTSVGIEEQKDNGDQPDESSKCSNDDERQSQLNEHKRKLSQPFLGPPTAQTAAQPGEPPPPSRQRGVSYIMPLRSLRKKSKAGESNKGSVHPAIYSTGVTDDTQQQSSRRGSRLTISQPPSRPYERKPSMKDNWKAVARDAFGIIDVNNDGFLQKEEVVAAISMMNQQGAMDLGEVDPAQMAESMMKEVDTDGDGQIDIDEFVEMMKKSINFQANNGQIAFSYNHRMSQLARNVLLAHQKKIENSVVGNDLWMIHPLSNIHATWDVIISVLILLTVLTMPLSLGWEEFNEDFFVMNLMVDFIFLLDVCKNFCTGFIDENDAIIMDARTVRQNYLSGFFLTDVCSSIPIDLILKAAGVTENNSAVTSTKQSLRVLRLLRLAKLFRLLRISRLFRHVKEIVVMLEEKLHIRISDGFTKLIRLGIGALVLGHWIGCFNFMLVRLHEFPEDSWVVYAGLEDKDTFTQWSWSFFKALAQMIMIGFETPPFTNASCDTASEWCGIEHWITLGCLYLGAVFYSLLISSISAILQSANLASRQFEEKLMQIDDYMRNKKLPAAMREKVKDYFYLQHSNGKLYNEAEILEMVTPILRREIKHFNGRDITVKVPMLSVMTNKEFAEEMTTVLEPTIAFQNEIILREKTTGEEMYFITSGVVEIFLSSAKNAAYVAIGDGCYFGEVSLVLDIRRTASARTKTQCMLYKIDRRKLLAVLNDFPEMAATMKRVAESRRRRLSHYVNPTVFPLLPGDEVDAEDCKTELFGVDADRIASAKEEQFEQCRKGRQSHRVADLMQRPPTPQRRKAHLGHGHGAKPA